MASESKWIAEIGMGHSVCLVALTLFYPKFNCYAFDCNYSTYLFLSGTNKIVTVMYGNFEGIRIKPKSIEWVLEFNHEHQTLYFREYRILPDD